MWRKQSTRKFSRRYKEIYRTRYKEPRIQTPTPISNGYSWNRTLYIAVLYFLYILIGTVVSESSIEVKRMTDPVVFGEKVVLVCSIHASDKPGHMAWKKIPKGQTIVLNNRSSDTSKYFSEMNHTDSNMNYTLEIKDFNQTDVNCVYKCESGFIFATRNMSLNKDDFRALPRISNTNWTLTLKDGVLNGTITINNIFPKLHFSILFKGDDITDESNIIFVERHLLYTVDIIVNYQTTECGGNVTVLCKDRQLKKSGETLNHYVSHCQNSRKQDNIVLWILVAVAVFLTSIAVILAAYYSYHRNKCTRLFSGEKGDDNSNEVNHSHEENDSLVTINYNLQTPVEQTRPGETHDDISKEVCDGEEENDHWFTINHQLQKPVEQTRPDEEDLLKEGMNESRKPGTSTERILIDPP